MWKPLLAIALGATAGAWLRWQLGLRLNAWSTVMPMGTLAANLIAAYVIGLAMGAFAQWPQLSPQWRLLFVTGFCGGLSTFSTFSAELVDLLQQQRWGSSLSTLAAHVVGSVALTFAGMATAWWIGHSWRN